MIEVVIVNEVEMPGIGIEITAARIEVEAAAVKEVIAIEVKREVENEVERESAVTDTDLAADLESIGTISTIDAAPPEIEEIETVIGTVTGVGEIDHLDPGPEVRAEEDQAVSRERTRTTALCHLLNSSCNNSIRNTINRSL